MYVVKSKTSGVVLCQLQDVEQAMLAEAADKKVEAVGRADVLRLAQFRCEQSPDYNALPDQDMYVKYTAKSGKIMVCEVIRLFHPDNEGYPQYLEVIHKGRPDTSFPAAADRCEEIDLDSLTWELKQAILNGEDEDPEEAPKPKLTKGLRRS